MNAHEILNAAISASNTGKNPFIEFEGLLNKPEPYLDLIRITTEYITPGCFPFIQGEERTKWLQERLDKFRIKYLEVI